ncbi:cytolysin secretion protein [Vibrio salilacus]|uniref:cytolysin secretion protein n=1 Tax=Vibrio salilacus TaxID=1323749 RepID=UPI000C2AA552|nr:cytolysin secretion protein [Vibrio salilacus]
MPNKSTIMIRVLTLLPSLFAGHAFSDIQLLGSGSDISQLVAEHYQQPVRVYDGNLSERDALYINVGSASSQDIDIAKLHVVNGEIVIVDLRLLTNDEDKIEQSQKITGLGSDAPVVITGIYQGDNIINSIVADVRNENGDSIMNSSAELESLNQSLVHALERLNFGGE